MIAQAAIKLTKVLVSTLLAITLASILLLQPLHPTPSYSFSSINNPSFPTNRTFRAHGNAAALFIQMGAYRGDPNSFAVVGLSSKPLHMYGRPWFECEWVSNANRSAKTKAAKMLPDWGYGRVYTVVVVNCTFPTNPNADNAGGELLLYAYYDAAAAKRERIPAMREESGSYDESVYSPPYKYDYLYCGSSLYGKLNPSRIREWVAYHAWLFGPSSHFVFHDAGGISAHVLAELEPWVRVGRVTVEDVRGQAEFDGYYFNQFLVVNDCLHRYRHLAHWTFFFDVDEYIFLPHGGSLHSVLSGFSNYTQFTIQQVSMSTALCVNDSADPSYSTRWGFEKLVFRDSRTKIGRDRKYAVQAKNVYATGVHISENLIGKTLHNTETKIRYYHYHNSINVGREICKSPVPATATKQRLVSNKVPYVYDDSMQKLAITVKDFERRFLNGL